MAKKRKNRDYIKFNYNLMEFKDWVKDELSRDTFKSPFPIESVHGVAEKGFILCHGDFELHVLKTVWKLFYFGSMDSMNYGKQVARGFLGNNSAVRVTEKSL